MLAVYDIILSADFEVMFPDDLDPGVILDEFMVALIDVVIKSDFVKVSLNAGGGTLRFGELGLLERMPLIWNSSYSS